MNSKGQFGISVFLSILMFVLSSLIGAAGLLLGHLSTPPNSGLPTAGVGGGPSNEASEGGQIIGILKNPDQYFNHIVKLNGEIDLIKDPRTLLLRDQNNLDQHILVISKAPIPENPGRSIDKPLYHASKVEVFGTVRQFNKDELEREVDMPIAPQIENDYKGKPVVVAETITFLPDATFRP